VKVDYLALLQALGPLPRTMEVAQFLNESYSRIYTLIQKGLLEVIKPAGSLRVVLNSLAEYLARRVDSIPRREYTIERDKELSIRIEGNGSTDTLRDRSAKPRAVIVPPHERKKAEQGAKAH